MLPIYGPPKLCHAINSAMTGLSGIAVKPETKLWVKVSTFYENKKDMHFLTAPDDWVVNQVNTIKNDYTVGSVNGEPNTFRPVLSEQSPDLNSKRIEVHQVNPEELPSKRKVTGG